MKGLKLTSGIILIFIVYLLIPKGFCVSSVSETVFLNPGQKTDDYYIQTSEGDDVKWSFNTYDDSFTVTVGCLRNLGDPHPFWISISSGLTSDSGSVKAITTGSIAFSFENTGSESGYIDIKINDSKENIIGGYEPMIFLIILISIVLFVSIKAKYSLKKRFLFEENNQ